MTEPEAALTRSQERLVVIALAFGVFVIAVNVNLPGALMPFVAEDPMYLLLSKAQQKVTLGQLIWVTQAAAAAASLLLGPVIDRVGRRGPMLVGGAMLVLGVAAHVFAGSHLQLLAARVVSGFAGGLVFTSASAAVADLVPYARRGAAMGVFTVGMFIATPVGLPVGIAIASSGQEAWRGAFGYLTAPAALALIGIALFLPAGLGRSDQRVSQVAVLRQPHVGAALLSVVLYTGAFFTTVQFAPKWLDETGLLPKADQSWLWIGLGLSAVVGALLLPRLADRFGKRNTVLVTTAGVAVCLVLLARVETVAGLLAVGLPMTMLAAARTPSLQALMSEIVQPRMRGTLMGLRAAAVNLGGAGFALVGAGIYAGEGYAALAVAAAATMVVAYLMVRFFVRVDL